MTGGSNKAGVRNPTGFWALLTGAPLVLWLGVGMLRPVLASAPPPAPSAEAAPANVPEQGASTVTPSSRCLGRFLAPFRAVAGSEPKDVASDWLDAVGVAGSALADTSGTDASRAEITTLVATIPDPIESGLSYQYETALQALRRGVERPAPAAYFRARSWLPWDDRAVSESERHESEDCRRSTPGVLLFRGGTPERSTILVLLVVGESPTSGVWPAALKNALSIYRRLAHWAPKNAVSQPVLDVPIIGPTYSGSAQSLRSALRSWASERNEPTRFRVVSGTATGGEVPHWLGEGGSALGSWSTLSFKATTVPEATVECAYLWYLAGRLGVGSEPGLSSDDDPRVALEGVATLSESGTEFGATLGEKEAEEPTAVARAPGAPAPPSACRWRSSDAFLFPFHVSALRDAYEDLDHQAGAKAKAKDSSIARATSLEASLRETRVPLDIEANPSEKTRTAEDLALGGVLSRISTRHVRHLAIHATDVGDAIFLARKIRDVAPDVRLAFFDSDALLLHAEFQRELLGSLVVSPYPFLGLSEFRSASGGLRAFDGFESGNMQGLYNAVLAQRGVAPVGLSEYAVGSTAPLPVWVSTIGRGTLVPMQASPTADCTGTLYGSEQPVPGQPERYALCHPTVERGGSAWKAFRQAYLGELKLEPNAKLPYLWDFLFATLCLAWGFDVAFQNRGLRRLARDLFPASFDAAADQMLDRAMGRTKWRLYAAIRSFLFALALTYMAVLYGLVVVARGGFKLDTLGDSLVVGFFVLVVALSVVLSVLRTGLNTLRFWREFGAFSACLKAGERAPAESGVAREFGSDGSDPPEPAAEADTAPASVAAHSDRITLDIRLPPPRTPLDAAKTSLLQLRILAGLTACSALVFTFLFVIDIKTSTESFGGFGRAAVPRLTLLVLRGSELASGVSPSTPALLCMACVYVWALGRMGRISVAHFLSRACPAEGEKDLVSMPIRMILYPNHTADVHSDAGFFRAERALLDSIWRPINRPHYVILTFAIAFFPFVVFFLKRPSTLESTWGTWFLAAGIALCSFLIGVTLIQLCQYWLALRQVLKRVMEHPLGAAFATIPEFARDSVEHQVSRSPDDALRWSTCALEFVDLMRGAGAIDRLAPLLEQQAALDKAAGGLAAIRVQALEASFGEPIQEDQVQAGSAPHAEEHPDERQARLEAALTCEVIRAASIVTKVLEKPWVEQAKAQQAGSGERVAAAPGARASAHEAGQPDALSPGESAYGTDELGWLREAQTFVATVVTLLIHRHLRQFRYFLHVTTASALLLLLVVTSYPFEPYRLLLTFIWIVVGSVVAAGLWVFINMDRNTLISHMAGTPPGELTLDGPFLLRVVLFGAVPLLSVAAAQYPQLADLLYKVVGPFTNAFH